MQVEASATIFNAEVVDTALPADFEENQNRIQNFFLKNQNKIRSNFFNVLGDFNIKCT